MLKLESKMEWLTLGWLTLLLTGCYPSEDLTVSELDIVVTIPDQSEDYGRFQTFAVPDSVVRVGQDESDEGPGPFDDLMLDLVRSNLTALGYVEEENPETFPPDLVVLVELLVVDNIVVGPAYPIWPGWGWWGGWYPGWGFGPGWGGYYPWVPVGQYTTGTVILDMIDPAQADDMDETVPIIWSAFINGLVTGSDAEVETRIVTNINQAFDQSPYLGSN